MTDLCNLKVSQHLSINVNSFHCQLEKFIHSVLFWRRISCTQSCMNNISCIHAHIFICLSWMFNLYPMIVYVQIKEWTPCYVTNIEVSTRFSCEQAFLVLQKQSLPVRATRRGKHKRLARTINSMGSRPGQGVSRPQYRNSSTPCIQAVLVFGRDTWKMTTSRRKQKFEKWRLQVN